MSAQSGLAFRIRNPWYNCYKSAHRRCTDITHKSWKSHGAKGIKCLLTEQDVKALWNRDQAWLLRTPSIDRVDPKGNYCFENCRFIEFLENSRLPHIKKEVATEWSD